MNLENIKSKTRDFLHSESFKNITASIICALIGIIVGFVILLLINAQNAPKAMSTILKNFMYYKKPSMRSYYLGITLVKSVPLIFCAFSVMFAYKTGLFNIGIGGQYCIGIGASLLCALQFHLPWYLCVLASVVVAALWGAIVGIFKALWNVNEVIASIMMNWIALYAVNILMAKETMMNLTRSETYTIMSRSAKSILPSLGLGKLFNNNQYVTIAIPLTIVFAVAIMIVLNKTTFGYELKATGLNKYAAKYAGMNDKMNIITTMAIAGALGGFAASFYFLTDIQPWKTSSAVPAMGFSGIAVAFLGGLNPIGIIFAGFFIEHISLGGTLIDMRYYNPQIADLISSIIIYVCAFVLFIEYLLGKITERKGKGAEK